MKVLYFLATLWAVTLIVQGLFMIGMGGFSIFRAEEEERTFGIGATLMGVFCLALGAVILKVCTKKSAARQIESGQALGDELQAW